SISFVSSLQISTFNKLDKWAYNSTMTTGNLRTATQAAYAAFTKQSQEAKIQFKEFSIIIGSFLFGALLGTFTTTQFGNKAIWVSAIILIVALVLYHKDKGYIRKRCTDNL
ncbi:MAG: YoaK family protein, partial [Niallia sp.]